MYPARSSNWWLATSASAGISRNVEINNLLQSIELEGESNSSMVKSKLPHMRIAIAADHAGFALKEKLLPRLAEEGHDVVDFGTHNAEPCDYPDFAERVAHEVVEGRAERGILVCSTGIGMAIAANKVGGVRAAPAEYEDEARLPGKSD